MRIKWLGHSCFKISSKSGIRIVTDPFDDNVGYKLPAVETDIVTISHGHYDHNFVECIKGDYEILSKVGNFNIKDIPITGIHTYHDMEQGQKRGNNIVYTYEIDGLRVCHLGDLGHLLLPSQIQMIGKVDILLIPVGGIYTIDSEGALEVIKQLNPAVIIPMHYKTPVLKYNLDNAEAFSKSFSNLEETRSQIIEINKENIDYNKQTVYLLKYE